MQTDGFDIQAFTIMAFCRVYGIGRTKAYEEISTGRLRTKKVGRSVHLFRRQQVAVFGINSIVALTASRLPYFPFGLQPMIAILAMKGS